MGAVNPMFARVLPDVICDKFGGPGSLNSDSVAIIDVPVGNITYYGFHLRFKDAAGVLTLAEMRSELGDIRLVVDGENYWTLDMDEALDLIHPYYNAAYGQNQIAGLLTLDLCEGHLRRMEHIRAMAWGTADVPNMRIEIDTNTLTNLTDIEFWAEYDEERRPLGYHKKIQRFERSFATTGNDEISTLNKEPARKYRAFHISNGSNPGVMDKVTLTRNNREIIDNASTPVLQRRAEQAGRTIVSGYQHLEFNRGSELLGGLDMVDSSKNAVSDLRLTPNWTTTPTSYRIIAEYVENAA